jgi:hypothetical protein
MKMSAFRGEPSPPAPAINLSRDWNGKSIKVEIASQNIGRSDDQEIG